MPVADSLCEIRYQDVSDHTVSHIVRMYEVVLISVVRRTFRSLCWCPNGDFMEAVVMVHTNGVCVESTVVEVCL